MDKGSFAAYLGRMGRAELAELRRVRPEAAESPGGFEVLAERLGDRGSLAALRLVSRDAIAAGQAAAALGTGATVDSVAALTGGDVDVVRSALGELRRVGVAWPHGEVVCLVPPVRERWNKATSRLEVTGRPAVELGRGGSDSESRSLVQHLLRSAYALLDTSRPIVGLKNGGVGARERRRWEKELGLTDEHLLLVLDMLLAAELMVQNGTTFEVTPRYERWRQAPPARQWAELAWTWFWLSHSPTGQQHAAASRVHSSHARAARWAVLRAARGGWSVDGIVKAAYWFCPQVHQHAGEVVGESEIVGVVAGDALSAFGEALLSADDLAGLASSVAEIVMPMHCEVEVLDDLKAVVFGQLTVEAARVLEETAESLVEDGARVWQFTAASIQGAFAKGWNEKSLLSALDQLTRRKVPWALRALLGEPGRGRVRVREVRCCVVAEAKVIEDVVRLPGFIGVEPTVAGSALAPSETVARLQAEGFAVVEDPSSNSVVVRRQRKRVVTDVEQTQPAPFELPDLDADEPSTAQIVRSRNSKLSRDEVALLASAIDGRSDVRIDYTNRKGESSQRTITPNGWEGHFLLAWCHARKADRWFSVERIRAVSPTRS